MSNEDRYPFSEVEPKWQQTWREQGVHKVDLDQPGDQKMYVLVMFSYPSSSKLHIGHWWNYGPTDTFARFKRMQGCQVFEPMGFDSFGLPAENYAIKVGTHPREVTESSIASIQEQLYAIGAMYDWDHSVITSRPDYYKWTQWLFLQLLKHKLAYRKDGMVNWCTSCQTVLANEQVQADGSCERCGRVVVQKKMRQWYFKITEYADKLLDGLGEIDWPESTVKRQQNWIGRSEGASIRFALDSNPEEALEVFTTRPDTIFGVTWLVIAPEHPLAAELSTPEHKARVDEYVEQAMRATDVERTATTREKTGVFTGSFVRHPFTDEKIPVWVADYVLGSYGSGAVMAVPAHDQRDFEFAVKHGLPMQVVIRPAKEMLEAEEMREAYTEPGLMVNSNQFNGLHSKDAIKVISEKLAARNQGGPAVTYRMRDWSVSRQRYWGAPIPVIHCDKCGVVPVPEEDLPVELPDDVKDFRPKGASPLGAVEDWMSVPCPECDGPARRDPDTMDTYVCSSFYHLRYLASDKTDKAFDEQRLKDWMPIDVYVGGSDHATGHLIYFRFITRFLHDIGISPVQEPAKKLIHQGVIKHGGIKMSKSKGNVVNPDEFVSKYGSDVFRMYLMFMGDYREGGDWSDEGITGIDRFINRIWRLVTHFADGELDTTPPTREETSKQLYRTLHHTIKSVGEDLEGFAFNTAISRMMELVNKIYHWVGGDLQETRVDADAGKRVVSTLILILAPFAPHFAEEAWHRLGGEGSVFDASWPAFEESALQQKTVTVIIQINGKVRDRIEAPADTEKERLQELAMASDKVQSYLSDGELRKAIVVPGKLVNLVIS